MKLYQIFFLLILLFFSCNGIVNWQDRIAAFKELRTTTFFLQVMKMKNKGADTVSLNFRVRLYPLSNSGGGLTANQKDSLNYRMDSCFYMMAGKRNVHPSFILPVNNGITNCFEYLVSFDINRKLRTGELQLVYLDKFIDQKKYKLSLNK